MTDADAEDRLMAAVALDEAISEAVGRQGELRTELALRTRAEAELDVGDITRVAHIFTGREDYPKGILDPMGLRTDQGLLEFGRGPGRMTAGQLQVSGSCGWSGSDRLGCIAEQARASWSLWCLKPDDHEVARACCHIFSCPRRAGEAGAA
ncbi:hypothetical protein [Actinacidiphila sp. bgisy167]|uniref:hypothetical protein n=1 Tax=Actinacidiphila sp. bgisy167 TaxID=3413797 RepID=UPI003D71B1D3